MAQRSPYEGLKSINHSVLVLCGTGLGTASVDYYNVEVVGNSLGEEVCKALPFFYAFTGCDTVSSFYGHSKSKFWDTWMRSENNLKITQVFKELSDQPVDISTEQMDIIERFILEVYYPDAKNNEFGLRTNGTFHAAC